MIDWKLGWNLAHIMSCAVEESLTWSLWFPEFVGNPKNKSPGPRPHFKGTDPQLPTSRAPGAGWDPSYDLNSSAHKGVSEFRQSLNCPLALPRKPLRRLGTQDWSSTHTPFNVFQVYPVSCFPSILKVSIWDYIGLEWLHKV